MARKPKPKITGAPAPVIDAGSAETPVHISVSHAPYCAPRLFEWMTASMMIGISLTTAFDPQSVSRGGFHGLYELGFSAPLLATFFMLAGCVRVAGLFANGMWPVIGPRFRAAGALAGSFIWLQMLYSLTVWSMKQGYFSLGVPVYACLSVGEFISCWRAASDVRR
jgi:hypothetical protein